MQYLIDKLDDIIRTVAPYTMVGEGGVRFTAEMAVEVIHRKVPGVFVECGVWKGGCSLAMLLAQLAAFGEVRRSVHMFDSFKGLPPAEERDGGAALKWQRDTDHNCRANARELKELINAAFSYNGKHPYRIWEGWFDQTLPKFVAERQEHREIALLRIDCDWFKSVQLCLEILFPYVSQHGIVIIDDYYAWDGCARAMHDFLSEWDTPYRIRSLPDMSAAYLVKE